MLAAPDREVVDPEHPRCRRFRIRDGHDQPHHDLPARRDAKGRGEPRARPARQHDRNARERPGQQRGLPRIAGGQALDLLGEDFPLAAGSPAGEPPDGHSRRRTAARLRPVLARPRRRAHLRQRHRAGGCRRARPRPRRPADRRQPARPGYPDDPHPPSRLTNHPAAPASPAGLLHTDSTRRDWASMLACLTVPGPAEGPTRIPPGGRAVWERRHATDPNETPSRARQRQ